jgi:N-acetylmuramic acid 6-phosphate etherase
MPANIWRSFGLVIGTIADGDTAIRKAVENAEDDDQQAWRDLQDFQIGVNDVVIGIAAFGMTPYVLGDLNFCKNNSIITGCIVCNQGSQLLLWLLPGGSCSGF